MLLLLDALHLGRQTFRGSFTTPRSGRRSLFFSKSILLLSFLRTTKLPFVVNTFTCPQRYSFFLRLSEVKQYKGKNASLDVFIIASVTSQFRETLTRRTKHEGIDGYFCEML